MDTNKVSDMHTSHNLLLTGLIYGRYCCWITGCVTGNPSIESRSWQHEGGEPRDVCGLLLPISISSSFVYLIILSPHRFWNDLNNTLKHWEFKIISQRAES
jgi:hypothetical protein